MSLRSAMTDQDLISAYAERRDAACFTAFVERHQGPVVRFATRLLGDREAAQDVAQETFLAVARRPKRLLGLSSTQNWLLRTARNIGVDHLRRLERQRRHAQRAGERAPPGPADGPLERLERREVRERVRGEIARLAPRQRELLLLRIQEGKSYREIAEITGLSVTNVGFILHQAVKALGRRLRDGSEG